MKKLLKLLFKLGIAITVVFVVLVVVVLQVEKGMQQERSETEKKCFGPIKTWPGYSELAKFSSKYAGHKVPLQGRIVQVIETYSEGQFDIRLDLGEYEENVVYLTNFPNDMSYGRPIEDEFVDGYALSDGNETYRSIWGETVTIPKLAWCRFS